MQYNTMFKDWLLQSGINEEVQEMFHLHVGDNWQLGTSIVIPVHDIDGQFLFNKYRKNPTVNDKKPKYVYDKGGRVTLYGARYAQEADWVLITEGEKDCLVAWSNNIPAVTSTGGALSFQEDWVSFFEGKVVYVCFDNDEAGAVGMVRVMKLLPGVRVVLIPDRPGIKDISDYVASGGDLEALIRTGKSYKGLEDILEDKAERKALWKSVVFHDAWLKENSKPRTVVKGAVKYEGDDLERAKQVPCDQVVKFNGHGKACCVWHNEKTPSMKWYKETNTVYCFGCGKHGDVVDLYKTVHGVGFKDALKGLNNE